MAAEQSSQGQKGLQAPRTLSRGIWFFDNGLPAAGVTVRLYNIAFGGKDAQLGGVTSDAQGKYLFSYSPFSGPAPDPSGPRVRVWVDGMGCPLDSLGREGASAGRCDPLGQDVLYAAFRCGDQETPHPVAYSDHPLAVGEGCDPSLGLGVHSKTEPCGKTFRGVLHGTSAHQSR
jgi:hypothetical protein